MDLILELSDNDDNSDLEEFYETYLQFLVTCSVHSLPTYVLRNLAVKLHTTLNFESEWKKYASAMGITDNLHLATIQESARVGKEQALYVTMTTSLQRINGNLANVIKALLDTKRFDALSYLKPYIQELLKEIPATKVKQFEIDTEHPICMRSKNSDLLSENTEKMNNETVFSSNSISIDKSENICRIELDPALFTSTTCELNVLQKNCEYRKPISEQLYPSLSISGRSGENGSLQQIKEPSALCKGKLSVFIQHTECDTEIAQQLSVKLKRAGIAVITLYDMDIVMPNDVDGALSAVLQEVDFIVPIVSQQFLQQIFEKNHESDDAKNNRVLYKLIMTEYRSNKSMNVRVRPVLVPDINRCLINKDGIIFSYSFRLWTELQKLIRVLKETKELIPMLSF